MTTGENLKSLRGDRTQDAVAKALGISKSALAMYERDQRTPRDGVKMKLAQYYGIPVERLFFTQCEHK